MKPAAISALLLALALTAGLLAGYTQQEAQNSTTPAPNVSPAAAAGESPAPVDETSDPTDRPQVRLAMLSGPTGMGAAKLMADTDAGTTLNDYTVELAAQPTEVNGKLVNGDLDIADLRGKTLYALRHRPGGQPGVCTQLPAGENVLDPASDVTIEWRSTGDEVSALMASGKANLAMLPVPAATAVLMQNSDVRAAVDFNDAWTVSGAAGTFTMGCVVVQTEFARENPQEVENFLTEYPASIGGSLPGEGFYYLP